MNRKGRPPVELVERARALAAEGKTPKEIAAALSVRQRAVKRWIAKGGQAALPSAASSASASSTPASDGGAHEAGPGEAPEAVIAEAFGPDPTAPPPPSSGDGFDDPLSDLGGAPLTTAELIGMADMGLRVVDGVLVTTLGGKEPRGLDDGQRGFLKLFGKRLSAAIQELSGGATISPKDMVGLAVVVLLAPRLVERIGGHLRRRRSAGESLSRGAEDGEDVRRNPMGAGDRGEAAASAAGG